MAVAVHSSCKSCCAVPCRAGHTCKGIGCMAPFAGWWSAPTILADALGRGRHGGTALQHAILYFTKEDAKRTYKAKSARGFTNFHRRRPKITARVTNHTWRFRLPLNAPKRASVNPGDKPYLYR